MDEVRIGNTLRVIRIGKHLRQADIAHRASVQREVVGRLERGGLGGVRCDTFLSVATALGIRLTSDCGGKAGISTARSTVPMPPCMRRSLDTWAPGTAGRRARS